MALPSPSPSPYPGFPLLGWVTQRRALSSLGSCPCLDLRLPGRDTCRRPDDRLRACLRNKDRSEAKPYAQLGLGRLLGGGAPCMSSRAGRPARGALGVADPQP